MASTTKALLAAKKAAAAEKLASDTAAAQEDSNINKDEQALIDADKAALEAAEREEAETQDEIGNLPTYPDGEGPPPETQSAVKEDITESDVQSMQEVAMQSGATEIPTGELAVGEKQAHAILQQGENPSEAETQTRRTEVDTHVTILPAGPTGTSLAADPPKGTLPNSGMILQDTGIMGSQQDSLQRGLSMNRISDEENEKAIKYYEGELRRQRMLEGRPRDTDLKEDQDAVEEIPDGAYKSNGILRFADKKGNWVNAVSGYFVPKDDEEKEILDHYVKTGVVEAPKS